MNNIKSLLITNNGIHEAKVFAEVAADELVSVGSNSPEALIKEATELKTKALNIFTRHIQSAMDHENGNILSGKHDMALPYESDTHADLAVNDIVNVTKGTSFEKFFARKEIQDKISAIAHHHMKTAMDVVRQHFHTSKIV